MNLPTISFDPEVLAERIESLRNRTLAICEDYDRIMSRVDLLEAAQDKCRPQLAEKERQLMGIIELFMRDDVRACTVMDYVIVFFRLVLAQMRQRGQDFDDVRQLCAALSDEDVAQTFRTVLSKMAFPASEQRAVKIVVEALQHYKWPTSEVLTTSPGGDAQISSALLYLRLQQDLDPVVSSALQRALIAAHECVISDMAVSEVSCDVNLNAHDIPKDNAHADARVKYEDYADLTAKDAEKRSSEGEAQKRHTRSRTPGENVCNESGGVGDAAVRSSAVDEKSRLSGGRRHVSEDQIKEMSESLGESGISSRDTSFDSLSTASLETKDKGCTKKNSDSTGALIADGNDKKSDLETDNLSASGGIDKERFAADPNLYVICYDASTSTSLSESTGSEADEATNENARHGRRRPKTATGERGDQLPEAITTNAATETENQ